MSETTNATQVVKPAPFSKESLLHLAYGILVSLVGLGLQTLASEYGIVADQDSINTTLQNTGAASSVIAGSTTASVTKMKGSFTWTKLTYSVIGGILTAVSGYLGIPIV